MYYAKSVPSKNKKRKKGYRKAKAKNKKEAFIFYLIIMSNFTKFWSINPVPEMNMRITTNDLEFYENDNLKGKKWIVPCGFKTDGCSIPFCFLWPKVAPRTLSACILHDYLWEQRVGFWKSNKLFYRALRALKVSLFRRCQYWLGVTLIWWILYFNILKWIRF